jgi:hypothetical protein
MNYSYIAFLISRADDVIEDIKEQFAPEDDEELASLILKIEQAIDNAEAYALAEVTA